MLPKGRDTQHSGRPTYNLRRPRPQIIYVEISPEPQPEDTEITEGTPPKETEE